MRLALEPLVGHMNAISTQGQIREVVLAVAPRFHRASVSRVFIGDADISSRNSSALLVRNRTADGSSDHLRARVERSTEDECQHGKQRADRVQFAECIIQIRTMNLHAFTPRGNICARKEVRDFCAKKACRGPIFTFPPTTSLRKDRTPKALKDVMLLY